MIGIDPGSRFCGYGVVERAGSRVRHVDCGVFAPKGQWELARRLMYIADGLEERLAVHRPDSAGVEKAFFAKNAQSALVLGHARGVALLTLARAGLTISEYAPTDVKRAVVGYGRADKNQVQQMVRVLLGLPDVPEQNAADALAVAICHCHHLGAAALTARASKEPSP